MTLETLVLFAGIIGLFVLLTRLSRLQMEVVQKIDFLNVFHRNLKMDTLDILYSFKEMHKLMSAVLERQAEIIDMVQQMESQEEDIEKAFQAVFDGMEEETRSRAHDSTGRVTSPKPEKPPESKEQKEQN
ncbi:unnamed protein product [marine sediment metagenome]|uniref:Uncharacterized protein n=1 Tax=marine sediment metagenome TaxID=412755 RepID=X0TV85_9ZZZZ